MSSLMELCLLLLLRTLLLRDERCSCSMWGNTGFSIFSLFSLFYRGCSETGLMKQRSGVLGVVGSLMKFKLQSMGISFHTIMCYYWELSEGKVNPLEDRTLLIYL